MLILEVMAFIAQVERFKRGLAMGKRTFWATPDKNPRVIV
jgi:hypothetical protein